MNMIERRHYSSHCLLSSVSAWSVLTIFPRAAFFHLHHQQKTRQSVTTELRNATDPLAEMLAALLGIQSSRVELVVDRDVIIVKPTYPSLSEAEEVDPEAILRGVVNVRLPGKRLVRRLKVVLEGTCVLFGTRIIHERILSTTYLFW